MTWVVFVRVSRREKVGKVLTGFFGFQGQSQSTPKRVIIYSGKSLPLKVRERDI